MSPHDPTRLRARLVDPSQVNVRDRFLDHQAIMMTVGSVVRGTQISVHRATKDCDSIAALEKLERSSDGVMALKDFIRCASSDSLNVPDFMKEYYRQINGGDELGDEEIRERAAIDFNTDQRFEEMTRWALELFNEIFTSAHWLKFCMSHRGSYSRQSLGADPNRFFDGITKIDRSGHTMGDAYFWQNVGRVLDNLAWELEDRERALVSPLSRKN